ncbi:hypothetical protein B0H13DRAFT_513516 [Mycena leptocephala]|nr:hypothetical protein B0H13DRAFT_513516 [Mycena leptocephala]
MEKLQSVNKNLRSSALRARTEAQENANLQKERFSDMIKERDQLLCKQSMSSATPRYCRREQDPHSNYNTRSSSEDDRHDRHKSERYSEDEKTQVCPTHLTAIFEQTRGQQPSLFNEPARLSQSEERLLYHNFIKKNFACPSGRPAFKDIQPIHTVGPSAEIFTHDISTNSLHFPKRSLWCSSVCDHALVFAPTHEYRHASDTWVNSSRMVSNCGQTFDLFMNKGDLVFYVGIYRVHSLRMVHPPGAKIPTDVSRAAILLAAGLHQRSQTKVNECFPDGEMRTECFGLQCVGFDNKLYDSLRERYLNIDGGKKRKAGPEDVRNDGKKKLQRV